MVSLIQETKWTLGTLSNDNDDGSENGGKKNEFPFFQSQMQATFPGVEFLRILFRLKEMKGNLS